MTQEEKQLLLVDLCSRLPYGVIGLYTWKNKKSYDKELTGDLYDELKSSWNSTEDSQFLPYLRPMDSMTKEETKELFKEIGFEFTCNTCGIPAHYNYEFAEQIKGIPTITNVEFIKVIDWLNAHHFDYRGLIKKGLALKATEGMYNIKNK